MKDLEINEEIENEKKITEYISEKKFVGGCMNINILGKAGFLKIIGGTNIVKINSHVKKLKFVGGSNKLIVRAPIDKLKVTGGNSLIYIHPIQNGEYPERINIGKIKIVGGQNYLYIKSNIDELNVVGGSSNIFCDFRICKINKFKAIGGNSHLNPISEGQKNTENLIDIQGCGVIKATKLDNNEIENPCMICLEKMLSGNEVYFLPCIHCFHKHCLKKWFENKDKCPECNLKIAYKLE